MDTGTIVYYLSFVPAIIIAITCHEFAHARMAYIFGDPTAHEQGRDTLNPLVHLDPIGTLGIVFMGFGWGKPVPVNVSRLRHPRADLVVSAAGPMANLLVAMLAGLLLRIPGSLPRLASWGLADGAVILASMTVHVNLMLAFFNFIPLGPLDGSSIVANLLPVRASVLFQKLNRAYGSYILLALILSGYLLPVSIFSLVLGPPINFFTDLILGS